jgi:uncharacterized protein YecE (DUF72 family)
MPQGRSSIALAADWKRESAKRDRTQVLRPLPKLYVGTSGYSYKEWKGLFYPEKIRPREMLPYYASRLSAVEINNTFYRLPKASVVESWKEQAPPGFRFSVKASRRITHIKRLKEAADETKYLLQTVALLGDRLGVVLFQLPPNMKKDTGRLAVFLDLLPENLQSAFEFRNDTWFSEDVFELLKVKECALVASDTDEKPLGKIMSTAGWGYLRLRRTNYEEADLSEWLRRVCAEDWKDVFIFFKHEDSGTGPWLAKRFIEMSNKDSIQES